jgi:hypothetical protein
MLRSRDVCDIDKLSSYYIVICTIVKARRGGAAMNTFVKGQIKLEQLEARMLEIAGTSDIDLKVPVGSKAVSRGTQS